MRVLALSLLSVALLATPVVAAEGNGEFTGRFYYGPVVVDPAGEEIANSWQQTSVTFDDERLDGSVVLIANADELDSRGLARLPDTLRAAVMLRDIQELSYQEIADRLALPEGTVKSRINRGRKELARQIRRVMSDEEAQAAAIESGRVANS